MMRDVKFGRGTQIFKSLSNLYECELGENCFVGPFVEIQRGVKIGNNVRIESHSFICTKTLIEDNVFIGHGVMFVNDLYPPRRDETKWGEIIIRRGASIGSNATILPCEIGRNALIGAGSVVTHNVEPNSIVVGNPARLLRYVRDEG